jgi:hypothetical protein
LIKASCPTDWQRNFEFIICFTKPHLERHIIEIRQHVWKFLQVIFSYA